MISSDSISRVDPYAIKEMEFNIKKYKKYTTIKSLIASLIVLALAISISFSSLQNLWLDRSQLQVTLLRKVTNPTDVLSETPVCIVNSNRSSNVIPRIDAYFGEDNPIPLVDRFTVATKYPYMMSYLNTSYFDCIDLAGTRLQRNRSNTITISTDIRAIAYIKTISRRQAFYGEDPYIIEFYIGGLLMRYLEAGLEKYVYKDRLAINYQPEVKVGISPQNYWIQDEPLYPGIKHIGNPMQIADIQRGRRTDNTQEFTIIRENIGQILGKFFAWYSLFLVIFVVAFGPIVEFTLNVELAKTLYTHQLLNSLQPSILVQIKYYLATCFSRCLPQRMICVAFQRLEQDMDIINLLKKQLMMRRISKQLRYSESRVELFVPDFAQDQNLDKQLLEKEQEDTPSQDGETQGQIKQPVSQFIVQTQQKSTFVLFQWLEKILCALDSSEVDIGLVYNNGNPYGSLWSIIIVVLGVGGMLCFLILSGVLSIQVDNALYTQTANRNQIQNITYTLKQSDIVFRIWHSMPLPWSNQTDYLQITDSRLNVLRNLTMQRGEKCKKIAQSLNKTFDKFMFCLPEDIVLYNDGQRKFNYIRLLVVESSKLLPFFAPPICDVWNRQVIFVNNTYRLINATQSFNYNNRLVGNLRVQIFNYEDQVDQIYDSAFSFFGESGTQIVAVDNGVVLSLQRQVQRLKIQSSSVWDIIDNTWGIIVLAFQIIIFKVSKFINRTIKSSKTQTERQVQRGNVVNIMANYNRLIHGSFSKQLNAVKFYFKQNLSISEIKL